MDLSPLEKLGKVAGVPGIALGVAALLLGAVLEGAGALPEAWRGPVLALIVAGAVGLGVLGIWAWARRGAQIARTTGDRSAAVILDKTKTGGSQTAGTKGADSPAIVVRE